MDRGKFITFEGGEGAGKSTQVARLGSALEALGLPVLTTREPGGSPGAEEIRRLLVDGGIDRWDGITEGLLHFAARRDHLRHTVWPALEAGTWVISDRFADSTFAYQCMGHGLPIETFDALYAMTVGDFSPDLTLVLDLPVALGLERAGGRKTGEDRYERMDADFHERVRQAFLTRATEAAERCRVIDASQDPETVAEEVRRRALEHFGLTAGEGA